ncbi:hypothetical protein VB620_12360 [Nodularia harveyana UHCC-0300]|uniref:Uncharacterized protein n=1 Tax=Nodularia harveyana UHCC-0300 TaxID=2974287 RepID=A0ABU5UF15_9CYAN|nr:hypothetical protein [Nodularia harveyana]MEA5582130.1 hypothetical protein [Nodularia harveyana UHCC-0300]
MPDISLHTETAFKRISAIVEKLIASNSLYQERLDRHEMSEKIYNLFAQPDSGDDINIITEGDLTNRINQMLVVEAMSGLLNDFTSEEMTIFDAAVKRK